MRGQLCCGQTDIEMYEEMHEMRKDLFEKLVSNGSLTEYGKTKDTKENW